MKLSCQSPWLPLNHWASQGELAAERMSAMVDYLPLDKGRALFSMGYEARATLVYDYIDYSVSSSPPELCAEVACVCTRLSTFTPQILSSTHVELFYGFLVPSAKNAFPALPTKWQLPNLVINNTNIFTHCTPNNLKIGYTHTTTINRPTI